MASPRHMLSVLQLAAVCHFALVGLALGEDEDFGVDYLGVDHLIPNTPIALLTRTAGRSFARNIDQYTRWHGRRTEPFFSQDAVDQVEMRYRYGLPGGVANGNDYNLAGPNIGEIALNVGLGRNALTLTDRRNRLALTSFNQKIFFAGGNGGRNGAAEEQASRRVEILTICKENFVCANELTSGDWLSQGREDLVAVSTNEQSLFAGGMFTVNKLYAYSDVVDIYDHENDAWETQRLAQARAALAATTVGNFSIFAGGITGTESETYYTDTVDIYDKDRDPKWTVAKLSQQRGHLAAVTINGTAIFAGGFYRSRYTGLEQVQFSDRVDIYDPYTKVWRAERLSVGRGKLAGAVVGNKVIFAGGMSADGPSDVVDILDITTGQWTVARLSQKRAGLVGVTMDCAERRFAMFFGGLAAGGFSRWHYEGQSARIEIYNGTSWQIDAMNEAAHNHAATLWSTKGGDCAIYIAGGISNIYRNRDRVEVINTTVRHCTDPSYSNCTYALKPSIALREVITSSIH